MLLCRTRVSTLEIFLREKPSDRGSAADPSAGSSPTSTRSYGPTATQSLTEWWVRASFLSFFLFQDHEPTMSENLVWRRWQCIYYLSFWLEVMLSVLVVSASLPTQCWITFLKLSLFVLFSNKCFCPLLFLTPHRVTAHWRSALLPRVWESSLCPRWFFLVETLEAKHDIKNSWVFEFTMQQEHGTPLIAWKINDFVVRACHNAISSYCVHNIFNAHFFHKCRYF